LWIPWPLNGGGTDTPLKVQGGAMTFRLEANAQFYMDGAILKDRTGNPCVVLNSKDGTVTVNLIQYSGTSTVDKTATLTSGAEIDLYGHTPRGDAESSNGIQVLLESNCNGSNFGASLIREQGGGSDLYANPYRDGNGGADDDKVHMYRFKDTSCVQTASASADEDTCEHLRSVYIYNKPPGKPKSGTPWMCNSAECRVEFVIPTR
jgi:hypothetical protein